MVARNSEGYERPFLLDAAGIFYFVDGPVWFPPKVIPFLFHAM
jgi:hypothetical protein